MRTHTRVAVIDDWQNAASGLKAKTVARAKAAAYAAQTLLERAEKGMMMQ